jgi:hypothetical protein
MASVNAETHELFCHLRKVGLMLLGQFVYTVVRINLFTATAFSQCLDVAHLHTS